MAYSPFEQGKLRGGKALEKVARRHGVAPACVAIAWTLRHPGVVSIPKAADPRHVRENAAGAILELSPEDIAELDLAFPPPRKDVPLEML